jgi:hypothetical protein
MLDTTTLLLILAVLQLGLLFFIYKNGAETLRLLRSGAGAGGGVAAVPVSKGERQEAERLAKAGTALREKVLSLPATLLGPGGDAKLRAAFLWTPVEVAALHPKTPALKDQGEEAAATAEQALGWLLEQAQRVRATPLGRGESYIDFPHDKWGRMHHDALDALQTLTSLGGGLGRSPERG